MLFYIVWTEFRIHLNFHILTTRWDIVSAKNILKNYIYHYKYKFSKRSGLFNIFKLCFLGLKT